MLRWSTAASRAEGIDDIEFLIPAKSRRTIRPIARLHRRDVEADVGIALRAEAWRTGSDARVR